MDSPTFSFLVPTHRPDRPLRRCLDSIYPQLGSGDEVIVIGDTFDGPMPYVKMLTLSYGEQFKYLDHNAGVHDFGHSQLNAGLDIAMGEFLHCNDDDDIWAPGAVAVMRQAAAESNGRPTLFRFQSYHGGIVFWAQRGLFAYEAVGGHCLVNPNIPGKVGRWGSRYQGDWDYLESTVALLGGPNQIIWRDEIVAIARPA